MAVVRRTSLAVRLLTAYALTVVLILVGLALFLDRSLEATFLRDLTSSLRAQGEAVAAALPSDDADLQPAVRELGGRLEVRVTVVREDGLVLADSVRDPSTMENHGGRAEVRAALDGRVGVATRTSSTTGRPYRYVALPRQGDRVVRVALPMSIVASQLGEVRRSILVAVLVAALVGVAGVWLIARRLTRPLGRLTASVERVGGLGHPSPAPVEGPRELAVLAETLNRMTAELEARVDEVRRGRAERESVLAAMEEGVVLVSVEGQVRYANPSAIALLGGGPLDRGLSSEGLRSVVEASRDGRSVEVEVEVGAPARIVRASAAPLGEDTLLILRDVTASRRVEAMRRDFVADASHELKTPAASIQAAAETVEQAIQDDPDAAGRFAAQLRRDAVRLSRLVSDLLDLSRLESERPSFDPVRLDRIVHEELRALRRQAEEAGVTLDWQGGAVTVSGSAKDLGLLARNLIDNALRSTPRGGRVEVRVEGDDRAATLVVADTGIGIPSRDLPRLFERFYRVDRARSRETGGTGLGLSIARHVAERHGGTIEAESELSRGSTFRVTMPTVDITPPGPAA